MPELGMKDFDADFETLEGLVDKYSLVGVLDALVSICHAKSEHLRSNWQDRTSARVWDQTAKHIERASVAAINTV